jgi:hypothetical protein
MLTDAQKSDVRRFAGYPMLADTVANDNTDFAYGYVSSGVWQTLEHRLTHMRPEEENTLISVYLANLTQLESAVPGAGDNLDTDVAAVWTRNTREVQDRAALFDDWRRRMCGFIGISPGPWLGDGGNTIALVRN